MLCLFINRTVLALIATPTFRAEYVSMGILKVVAVMAMFTWLFMVYVVQHFKYPYSYLSRSDSGSRLTRASSMFQASVGAGVKISGQPPYLSSQ